MNIIDNSGKGIAALGRDEDRMMAHVASGEMVVPPVISESTKAIIRKEMQAAGLDPNEYQVGQGMSINPITGMAEFGFLKKLAKTVKKVVKKIAPIAAAIPGPWQGPAIMYNRGRAVLNIAKGEGGIGDLITAFTPAKAYTGGKTGNIFGNTKEFFTKGSDGVGFFGNIGKGISKAGDYVFKGSDDVGLFGNLGKSASNAYDYVMPGSDDVGLFGNLKNDLFTGTANAKTGLEAVGDGTYMDPVTKDIYTTSQLSEMGLLDASGNLKGSALSNLSQGKTGGFDVKDLFGGGTDGQSRLGLIEDMLKGRSSDPVREGGGMLSGGGGGGIDPKMAALALLYGKAVKDYTQKTSGGLRDVRNSIRSDLNPQPVFQGFDLGIRKNAANGGEMSNRQYFRDGGLAMIAEQDMRDGGESEGPGTGTSDDIPAMLSDGEFVMTAAANKGSGGFEISKTKTGIELIPGGKPNRKKGVENMNRLMSIFEDYNSVGRMA